MPPRSDNPIPQVLPLKSQARLMPHEFQDSQRWMGRSKVGAYQHHGILIAGSGFDNRQVTLSAILTECYTLNPAWVEQVADATRQAVKCP